MFGLLVRVVSVLAREERAWIASEISFSGLSGLGVKVGKSVTVGVAGGEGGNKVGGEDDTPEEIMSPLFCFVRLCLDSGVKFLH
jgi:hypothetical protein